jgi:hypothetical protein
MNAGTTLLETLPDGTQNYLLDVSGLGMFFMSMFEGHVVDCTTWHDHIETYPEHKRTWCDVQVSSGCAMN